MNETEMTNTLPVRYYIGDLCYVMHDAWDEVCSLVPYDNSSHEFILADGRKFFMFGTAYGDGVYEDSYGNEYSVDSGTIGAIRVDDIRDPDFSEVVDMGLGHILKLPAELQEFECSYENGVIYLGHVMIDTDPSYEEEEELDLEQGFDPYDGCYTGDC